MRKSLFITCGKAGSVPYEKLHPQPLFQPQNKQKLNAGLEAAAGLCYAS